MRRTSKSIVALILLASFVSASIAPLAGASEAEPLVCGRVVNAAGWPLENIEVKAIPSSVDAGAINDVLDGVRTDDPAASTLARTTVTDADGQFAFELRKSTYRLLFRDLENGTSVLRNGATYNASLHGSVSPRTNAVVEGACPADEDGIPYGDVVLVAPGQGFLEVRLTDAAAAGAPPLAHADVAFTPTITPYDDPTWNTYAHAHTDAAGEARIACAGGAPNVVRVSKDGWIPRNLQPTCVSGVATVLAAPVWRMPLALEVTVTNETDLLADNTGITAAEAGVASRVPGAIVAAKTPAELAAGQCPAAAPGAVVTVRPLPLDGAATTPYVCQAAADARGVASLLLPWSMIGDYDLTATAPAYATHARTLSVAHGDVLWPSPNTNGATSMRSLEVLLQRASVTLTQTVRDVQGAPLEGVEVTFANADAPATTDAAGVFTLEMLTGQKEMTLTLDGYVTRTCTFALSGEPGGSGVISNPQHDHCFTLVASGMVAVLGTVKDNELQSVPVPDLEVCSGAVCDTTDAAGGFQLELEPETARSTIAPTSGQAWTKFVANITGNAPATAGEIAAAPGSLARRATAVVTIHVQEGSGAPIAGADVHLQRGSATLSPASPANVTNAEGDHPPTLLIWTTMPGSPAFDLAAYTATARRQSEAIHFLPGSTSFHVLPGALEDRQEPITLASATGTFSLAVAAHDLDNGDAPASTILYAVPVTPGTSPPIAAGPQGVAATPGTLLLYAEHAPYRVCARATAGYQATAEADCVIITDGGTLVDLGVRRTLVNVTIRGLDAHTGALLSAYNISTSGTIQCGGAGTACIDDTAASGGGFKFVIPWALGEERVCFEGTARAYAVMLLAGGPVQAQENVAFQATQLCREWPQPTTPQTSSYTIDLRALRAPATAPLTGDLLDMDDQLVAGALVAPVSERVGFVCDPESNSTASFPACAGVSAATGTFSLSLPVGGANTTWSLTATAEGYYDESRSQSIAALAADFVMWPRSFTAIVEITDVATGTEHACGSDVELAVTAHLRDLTTLDNHAAPAVPTPQGSCVAEVVVLDWHRDPMTLPAAASAVPGKTNHTYLVLADQSEHLGAAISLLGPRDDDRRVSVQMLHTAASSAGTVVVSGRVFDADLIATLNGDLGVPATLRATGDCGAPVAYSTTTDALGRYELTLGCAGTYTIETTALVPGYWTTSTTTLIVPATGLADADIGLAREKATLTVDVEFLSGAAANRVTVDPAGVDVASDPSAKEATGGTAVYTGIPWGTYTIAASAASGAGTPVPTTPVFLRPPGERAVVYVL